MEINAPVPKLIFKYAFPLDRNRRALYKKNRLGEYPSVETVKEQTNRFEKLWKNFEKIHKITEKISALTGVTLTRDLEVYTFGMGLNPMSKPLMMPVIRQSSGFFTDDQFLETIVHELCHRFAGDEEETPRLEKYWDYVKSVYENESSLTRSHIIVYALLKSTLNNLDVPEHPEYLRALQIVEESGVKNILNEFKRLTS